MLRISLLKPSSDRSMVTLCTKSSRKIGDVENRCYFPRYLTDAIPKSDATSKVSETIKTVERTVVDTAKETAKPQESVKAEQIVENTSVKETTAASKSKKDKKSKDKKKKREPMTFGEFCLIFGSLSFFGGLGVYFVKISKENKRRQKVEDDYEESCPLNPPESINLNFLNNVHPEAYRYLWELLVSNGKTEITLNEFYDYIEKIGIPKEQLHGRSDYERLIRKIQNDIYMSDPSKYDELQKQYEESIKDQKQNISTKKETSGSSWSLYSFITSLNPLSINNIYGIHYNQTTNNKDTTENNIKSTENNIKSTESAEEDNDHVMDLIEEKPIDTNHVNYDLIPIPVSVLMSSFLHLLGGDIDTKIDIIYDIYKGKNENMSHEQFINLISDLFICYHLNSDYMVEIEKDGFISHYRLSTIQELAQQALEKREKIAHISQEMDINREELKAMLTDIPICIWGECQRLVQRNN
ncbi:hypothetical protein WA158_005343 [Blastocystis sp. Blastoise]